MKIKKNPTKVEAAEVVQTSADYSECLKHIKAAIDVLGSMNNKDTKTKDAIANLGVVYFDLK